MLDASRQSFLVSAILCLPTAGLFAARALLVPWSAEAPFTEGMPLSAALTDFSVSHPLLSLAVASFFAVWTMIIVARLALKYAPAGSRNYLPAQFFLIGSVGILIPGEVLGAYIAAWLLALASRQGGASLRKGYRFVEVFRAGLYLGMMPLLYAPATAVSLVLAMGMLSIYRRSGRETIVCAAGLALPLAAAGFIHWALGADAGFIWRELWHRMSTPENEYAFTGLAPAFMALTTGLILFVAATGCGWALSHRRAMRKTPYKFMRYTSLMLATLVASVGIPGSSSTLVPLAAVAAALCAPYAFSGKWALVSSIMYCAMILAVLILNLAPLAGILLP